MACHTDHSIITRGLCLDFEKYTWNIWKNFNPEVILKNTLDLHIEQTNLNIITHLTHGIGQFPLNYY